MPTPDEEEHWESSHHGGLNVLWCDGHVKRMRYRQLSADMFSIQSDPN
jgi:prepilin-type processing-associated H-X9-DG protein